MTEREHETLEKIRLTERSRREAMTEMTLAVASHMRTTLNSLADILEQAAVLLRGAAETNIGAELDATAAAVRTADHLIDEYRADLETLPGMEKTKEDRTETKNTRQ